MTVCIVDMQVAKVVAPKKAALKEAEGSYEEVMVGLQSKSRQSSRYALLSQFYTFILLCVTGSL